MEMDNDLKLLDFYNSLKAMANKYIALFKSNLENFESYYKNGSKETKEEILNFFGRVCTTMNNQTMACVQLRKILDINDYEKTKEED